MLIKRRFTQTPLLLCRNIWYNEIYYIANTSLTYVEENVSELEATEIINLIYLLGGDINE